MRMCFTVRKDEGLESVVYNHFGSAPVFLVVDTEEGGLTAVKNTATHHPQGACTPIEDLINMQIDAIALL